MSSGQYALAFGLCGTYLLSELLQKGWKLGLREWLAHRQSSYTVHIHYNYEDNGMARS